MRTTVSSSSPVSVHWRPTSLEVIGEAIKMVSDQSLVFCLIPHNHNLVACRPAPHRQLSHPPNSASGDLPCSLGAATFQAFALTRRMYDSVVVRLGEIRSHTGPLQISTSQQSRNMSCPLRQTSYENPSVLKALSIVGKRGGMAALSWLCIAIDGDDRRWWATRQLAGYMNAAKMQMWWDVTRGDGHVMHHLLTSIAVLLQILGAAVDGPSTGAFREN
ncbi:hypothetical protein BJ878DRAFT_232052 [Calycina marina]|uniref:Uncharacterized protein n=1 Tax=Calycina marina TaxID=1763456 RepID=A0A9P7YX55_9HELO|nr:hypothetical protein BJ878DRAFT_232052 [Calycina marina]